jgi:signal peptidase I
VSDAETKPRRTWIAFLLSLLLSGLGQLYCGRVRAAGLFLGLEVFFLSSFAVIVLGLWSSPWLLEILALCFASALSIKVINLGDAAIGAKRAASFTPAWFNRWYFYVLLVAVIHVANAKVEDIGRTSIEAFHVPAMSMAPTIQIGDYFMAGLRAYRQQNPKRCDIIVFAQPSVRDNEKSTIFVKRVVATEGDDVQYRAGRLFLNGAVVPRDQISTDSEGTVYRETLPGGCSYLILERSDNDLLDNTRPAKVLPGTLFVLGDNRDDSSDSRTEMIGLVPLERVRGRALLIYWAKDLSRVGSLEK